MSEAADKIIETLKSADNEATRAPYWMIINPSQLFRLDPHHVASMIYGPFFCREDAQNYLDSHRYNFNDHATVYCHSGHFSKKYENLWNELRKVHA